jgi:hypothetical protein
VINRIVALQDDGRLGSLPIVSGETQLDAFGRIRISEPVSVFEQSFQRSALNSVWSTLTATSGSVTHNANLVSMLLGTTTTSGSLAVLQSRKRPRYVPGKSQIILLTGNMWAGQTNLRRRLGLFDESNGVFFEQLGTQLRVVLRSSTSGSAVDSAFSQANWNLDRLDGTGPSGVTLDITKQQIFVIDFQWLGSGRIRYGFVLNGILIYCHEIINQNVLTVPYSQNGSLPIRAEQQTLAALGVTPQALQFTCASVQSEGGFTDLGYVRSANNAGTSRAINGNFGVALPMIAVRKASDFAKLPAEFFNAQVFASTADDLLVTMVKNPTLTGGSWVSVSNSIMEANISATAISGGLEIGSYYIRGNSGTESTAYFAATEGSLDTFIGSDISNVSDVIAIRVQSVSGGANAFGIIYWKEFQ